MSSSSQGIRLHPSIKKYANKKTRLLDSIGIAEMEKEFPDHGSKSSERHFREHGSGTGLSHPWLIKISNVISEV